MSLKKIKYLFGQRATVARAILGKVMKGKPVANHDVKGLSNLYYDVSSCLITLRQLNYASDLYSSDTLAQAVRRLPPFLMVKWAERSMFIRSREEPSLVHFGDWLKQRVLVMKEVVSAEEPKKKGLHDTSLINTLTKNTGQECQSCGGTHTFWKCQKYKALEAPKRWEFVKELNLCMNCFKAGHKRDGCTSENVCLREGCGKKHHASLHVYFEKQEEVRKARKQKQQKQKRNENIEAGSGAGDNDEDVALMLCPSVEVEAVGEQHSINAIASRPSKVVFLHIVPVTIKIGKIEEETYALLDNGA